MTPKIAKVSDVLESIVTCFEVKFYAICINMKFYIFVNDGIRNMFVNDNYHEFLATA